MRAPLFACACLVLLLVVPEKRTRKRILLTVAAFISGAVLMNASLPSVPDKPSWAAVPRQAVLVEGTVHSSTGLPGGRVRILLEGLRQTEIPSDALHAEAIGNVLSGPVRGALYGGRKAYAGAVFEDDGAALPGLTALTLDSRVQSEVGRPLPGQKVTALLRLYPSGGSRNALENGASAYWASREVWHNARLVWHKDRPRLFCLSGDPDKASRLREGWRASMLSLLEDRDGIDGRVFPGSDGGLDTKTLAGEAPAFSQGHAMLPALLFGDRSCLSPRTIDLFTRAGLIHSLALSGQHLALAAMAGWLVVMLLIRVQPSVCLLQPRRVLVTSAGLPFALGYLFLGGAPFSLIRAAFMMLAAAWYLSFRRPSAPLDALLCAVLLLFLGWPSAVFDLSVQLSVLAVAGILLGMPVVLALQRRLRPHPKEHRLKSLAKKILSWSGTMVLISCFAQVAVLPVLATTFGAVSPCFWLNLLWLPPLTFITLPLAALALLIMLCGLPDLSSWLFSLAAWPADRMLDLLEWFDASGWLPFVQCFRPTLLSSLGYGVLLVALAVYAHGRLSGSSFTALIRRLLICAVVLFLLGQAPQWWDDWQAWREQRVSLSLLDVGQGQAVLLEYPGGRLLVDGGGSSSPFFDYGKSVVAPALTDSRFPRLDAVLVSHTDMDHARGLRWILEHFHVGALYWSAVSADRASHGEGALLRALARRHNIPERVLGRGDRIELGGGLTLDILHPAFQEGEKIPEVKVLSSNNASLVLRLKYNEQGLALLCGDILTSGLEQLVKSGQGLRASALILPHHGAASSYHAAFYEAVSPQVAAASAASYNHYGFPNQKIRETLARSGIPVYSTSAQGTIRLTWKLRDGHYELQIPEHMIPIPLEERP